MTKLKLFALCTLALAACNSVFAGDPVENLIEGCGTEIENYCNQVTLGEGRLMACFYAHEDKLSVNCLHSLYDAAAELEAAINALVYIATECKADIDEFCGEMVPGEGRILNCLSSSQESLGEQCSSALQGVKK